MAEKESKPIKQTIQNLETVEVLKQNFNVSEPVFKGVLKQNNWQKGKAVTEAEFKRAVTSFNQSPVGRS